MTEREARIAFNMIPTVGAVRLARLMAEVGGSAADAYEIFPERKDWAGNEPAWEREIEQAEKMHVRIVTEIDADYPPLLREIASPPLALYVVGDVSALAKAGVALVGTRRATPYGQLTAEKLAGELARRGWAVFSGLARGIDASAHHGALVNEGVTVGVLGGALDRFFPEENRDLARKMVEKGGAVVSEFPFGRSPDMQTFPQRNRIVSGLSRGVVAVECPSHSGTLITCSRAVEQGRSVMAVPGRIDSSASAGCLQLIRDGARLVTCVDDIVEELTPLGHAAKRPNAPAATSHPPRKNEVPPRSRPAAQSVPEVKISAEEAQVLGVLSENGMTIEHVVAQTRLPMSQVNTLLVSLRLKGRVNFLPGNRVALKRTE